MGYYDFSTKLEWNWKPVTRITTLIVSVGLRGLADFRLTTFRLFIALRGAKVR